MSFERRFHDPSDKKTRSTAMEKRETFIHATASPDRGQACLRCAFPGEISEALMAATNRIGAHENCPNVDGRHWLARKYLYTFPQSGYSSPFVRHKIFAQCWKRVAKVEYKENIRITAINE